MATLPTTFINVSDIYRKFEEIDERLDKLEYCINKLNSMSGNMNAVLKQLVEEKKYNGKQEEFDKGSS